MADSKVGNGYAEFLAVFSYRPPDCDFKNLFASASDSVRILMRRGDARFVVRPVRPREFR